MSSIIVGFLCARCTGVRALAEEDLVSADHAIREAGAGHVVRCVRPGEPRMAPRSTPSVVVAVVTASAMSLPRSWDLSESGQACDSLLAACLAVICCSALVRSAISRRRRARIRRRRRHRVRGPPGPRTSAFAEEVEAIPVAQECRAVRRERQLKHLVEMIPSSSATRRPRNRSSSNEGRRLSPSPSAIRIRSSWSRRNTDVPGRFAARIVQLVRALNRIVLPANATLEFETFAVSARSARGAGRVRSVRAEPTTSRPSTDRQPGEYLIKSIVLKIQE